jgi:hypothetical protein
VFKGAFPAGDGLGVLLLGLGVGHVCEGRRLLGDASAGGRGEATGGGGVGLLFVLDGGAAGHAEAGRCPGAVGGHGGGVEGGGDVYGGVLDAPLVWLEAVALEACVADEGGVVVSRRRSGGPGRRALGA